MRFWTVREWMVMRMTKCEKCIHGDICANRDCMDADDEIAMTYCAYFIGKSDFVEVVRCKDCQYANDSGTICRYGVGRDVKPDHFCGYGERRKDKEGIEQWQ